MMVVVMVVASAGKGRRRKQQDGSQHKNLFHAANHSNNTREMASAARYFQGTSATE